MQTTTNDYTRVAQDMRQFVTDCAKSQETLLLAGQLPPVVRGQRLSQTHRDKRPHMGGSSAENGSHYAAFLALLRNNADAKTQADLDERVLKSVTPFLGQSLVPFAHRAVLQTLAVYGALENNALWQRLTPDVQAASRKETFSVASYYDAETRNMRTLPDNYLWITTENARLISVLLPQDEAAQQAAESAFKRLVEKLREKPWFDDNPPYMVIDQYAWETVAAAVELSHHYASEEENAFLSELAARYRDSLYKLARADGYAFCWGRSQGVISYGTTIYCLLAFGEKLLTNGAIDEADFANDLALIKQCFHTLKTDWFDDDGLTTMHLKYRETFSYRRSHRLVGSTYGMLVKFLHMARQIEALAPELTQKLPETAQLPATLNTVLDFTAAAPEADDPSANDSKSNDPDADDPSANEPSGRLYGLWLGKNQHWHIALPIVGNLNKFDPKVTTNYLPAPLMPFVMDVPAQHSGPYGTQYIELQNGEVFAAVHGCDAWEKTDDGIKLAWHSLLNVDTLKYADDIGRVEIAYRLDGERLSVEHSFTTERSDILNRYSMLGVALEKMRKLSATSYVFEDDEHTLHLEAQGELEQLNVENVVGLPASKSFLGVLPWALSFFLPATSSSFTLELNLSAGAKEGAL